MPRWQRSCVPSHVDGTGHAPSRVQLPEVGLLGVDLQRQRVGKRSVHPAPVAISPLLNGLSSCDGKCLRRHRRSTRDTERRRRRRVPALRALASYSGLSIRTLRGYLSHRAHPLPHYRVGGKVFVRRLLDRHPLRSLFRTHCRDPGHDHVREGLEGQHGEGHRAGGEHDAVPGRGGREIAGESGAAPWPLPAAWG
jgi:hypothetical protein